MDVRFDPEEVEELQTILEATRSDLRMEIRDTESHEWREALHRREAIIDALLARLSARAA